jgi:hypothetical protein
MVAMTETEIDPRITDDPETWLTRWKVPAVPVLVGMILLTLGVFFGFLQLRWDREANASALANATCRQQREFRGFFADYLESQIGTPIEDIPGFDQLSPEAREFAIQLAPVVEAGRQKDAAAYAEYILKFPIPNCDG